MKIKNTAELRRRANGHARRDRVVQGTYGRLTRNGKVEFQGCAIGCLAVPHRQADLRKLWTQEGGGRWLDRERADFLDAIEEEFGIPGKVMLGAERIFENLPTHGAAIEFVPALAAAFVKDAEIDEDDARRLFETAKNERTIDGAQRWLADLVATQEPRSEEEE